MGRLHREHVDKEKVIVYDYLDNMKVLENMYARRLKGYKIAGYEIVEWGNSTNSKLFFKQFNALTLKNSIIEFLHFIDWR